MTVALVGVAMDNEKAISWQAKIVEVRDQIKDIHPFLERLYPVALGEGDSLSIYDYDTLQNKNAYVFIKKVAAGFTVPDGIEASFPLEAYDGKSVCVITPKIFSSLNGYATIFHEFVYCTQWQLCEPALKADLDINRKAMAARDYMWELNHPFAYSDAGFVKTYSRFLDALEKGDSGKVYECRRELKKTLSPDDYEYMVWQEWKEGFARRIENEIHARLGFSQNHYGAARPYSRITFYEGGAGLIEFLVTREHASDVDIQKLYNTMMDMGEQS